MERWLSHGPYGGSVSVLLPSLHPDGGLYAGVLGHGIYRISGTADKWERRSDGLDNMYVKALVQNPAQPDILYIGTRTGVYWTTDGGLHWEPRTEGIGATHVEALAIDPINPQVLYAESFGTVYKSVNAGATWEPTGPGIPSGLSCHSIVVDPSNSDVVYAGTADPYGYVPDDAGVYKSVSGGAEWFPSGTGLLNTQVQSLTLDPSSPQTVYAGTYGNEYVPFGGVYVSYDAGANWTWISNGLPTETELAVNSIAVTHPPDADVPVLFAAGSYGYVLPMPPAGWEPRLYKSVDGGVSWQQSTAGVAFPNLLSVVVDPSDHNVVYLGSDCGGVFRSTDSGESFSHWSTGLERLCVRALVVHPQDERVVYAGVTSFDGPYSDRDAGVYVSFDGGVSWQPRLKDMCITPGYRILSVAVALCNPETVYAANCGWMLYKSTDQGLHWHWRGFPHGIDGYWLTCVVVDPSDPQVAYVSGAGFEPSYPDIYKTEDCGETWRPVASWIVGAAFTSLAIDPSHPQTVYAGSSWEGVYKTTDGGDTWDPTGPEILGTMVNAIVVDPQDPQQVYAADNTYEAEATGVYVSYDGGGGWQLYNDGLLTLDVEALAIDSTPAASGDGYPPVLYAGTEGGGVFRRCEGGIWEEINEGLEDLRVYSLALGPAAWTAGGGRRESVLYAGTASGVYRRIVVGDLDGDGDVDLSDLAALLSVYGTIWA